MVLSRKTLCIALQLGLAVSIAAAQPKLSPTAEAIKKADAHFYKGEEYRRFGNQVEAIKEFLAGYELTGSPQFLFNIGQAYREQGGIDAKRSAVGYYKKYIAAAPKDDGVMFAKSHIEILEKEIRDYEEAIAAQKQKDADADAKRKADAEAARKTAGDTAKREAEVAARTKVSEAEDRRRRTTSRALRIGGVGLGAAGMIAAGVGIYFGRKASSLSDEASREATATKTWTDELEQKVDDANAAQTKMYILFGSAGVVILGGSVAFVVGQRMQRPAERRLVVAPMKNGAGIVLGGRF